MRFGLAPRRTNHQQLEELCHHFASTKSPEVAGLLRQAMTLLGALSPSKPLIERALEGVISEKSNLTLTLRNLGTTSDLSSGVEQRKSIVLLGPVDFEPSYHRAGNPYALIYNPDVVEKILNFSGVTEVTRTIFLNQQTQCFVSSLPSRSLERLFPPGSTVVAKPDPVTGNAEPVFTRLLPLSCKLEICASPQDIFVSGEPNMLQNAVWHLLHHFEKVKVEGFNLFTSHQKYSAANTIKIQRSRQLQQLLGFSHHDPIMNWLFLKALWKNGRIETAGTLETILRMSFDQYLDTLHELYGVEIS